MSQANRLEFLKRAGQMAWKGLKTVVTGVEIIDDPNAPQETAAGAAESAHQVPVVPRSESQTTVSLRGQDAMRAAQHRVAAATLTKEGSAVDVETLHAGVTPTLALYPTAAESVVERHLGLGGERLSIGCNLDEELPGYHLVWLPLADGVRIYSRLQGGRIALVGGYGRAALVEFGNPVATSPVWCSVGDVGLMSRLPAEVRERLVMEEHRRLLDAIRSGRAQVAVLGGADLQWAEGLPAARVVLEIKPQLDLEFLPLWGLFTSGRPPLVEGLQTEHLRLVCALDSTLEDWSKEEPA